VTGPTPLDDRRQRAREAYYDGVSLPESHEPEQLEAAIETATRVRVDDDVVRAFDDDSDCSCVQCRRDALVAAFTAAGFEVEQ
jgi:hypothetical protein